MDQTQAIQTIARVASSKNRTRVNARDIAAALTALGLPRKKWIDVYVYMEYCDLTGEPYPQAGTQEPVAPWKVPA
jgi:hypothetical protein